MLVVFVFMRILYNNYMRKLLLALALLVSLQLFAQEGTKQLMPNANDRLWLEFNAFDGNNFGMRGCSPGERINIYLNAGEKLYLGLKLNTTDYTSNIETNPARVSFCVRRPNGTAALTERYMPTSGEGFISNWSQAVTGPNGAKINGTTISAGYAPLVIDADVSGNYYIEFDTWYRSGGTLYRRTDDMRFALEFFDVTVADNASNVITNSGEPNISAGRLWSYGWSFTTTSFDQYPVNAHFYVFTSDEFINKVNFKVYPYSFVFIANNHGVKTYTDEKTYIERAQSLMGDQMESDVSDYRVFLNDPDRTVWPNTTLAPPKVQVWAEDTLVYDYSYNRNPLLEPIDYSLVVLEKNRLDCPYEDVTFYKIETNIDGFAAILIDLDGDNEYSTSGSDRVIYKELKKGLNYVLWNFKSDAGAIVENGRYWASASFLARGTAHFPMYDVEQLDGITTSSIRPFNKLKTTLYWDDTQITRWGDETNTGLMNATKKKQLVIDNDVPRIWSWNPALEFTNHNGNLNSMNTWFNAIDLGYSKINLKVQNSETKCVDGNAPWVGDIYVEGPKNTPLAFTIEDFDYKFFHAQEAALHSIQVRSLPANGVLRLLGAAVTVNQKISRAQLPNLVFTPNANWSGKTSFVWRATSDGVKWSNNQENVYAIINTPPTITKVDDQTLCTNSATAPIAFTVGDSESVPEDLVVTGFSADPTFVPHTGIAIGGTGTNRTVAVTPVANRSGRAIIYLMVDDGFSQVIEQFTVYVGPDLQFSGDTTVCVGEPLYLIAKEIGAAYTWKYGATVKSTSQSVQQAAGSVNVGDWSLTVSKDGCTSTRNFSVEVSPLTTFTGDLNVCVGEAISLTATEVNAVYQWRKNGTAVSSDRTFSKASAALTDAASTYNLYVRKDGCENTSPSFAISVVAAPNAGLAVQGSMVDPGKSATVTVVNPQDGITYSLYSGVTLISSGVAVGGTDLVLDVPSSNLSIGTNTFQVRANNGNCEIELTNPGIITVNQPGITVSATSIATTEGGVAKQFSIVLDTEPSANVTIAISSGNIAEGTVSPTSITFNATDWNTPRSISVTPVRDWVVDGPQTYTVTVAAAVSGDANYNGLDAADVTVTNADADVASVVVSKTNLSTSEAGGNDSFTLVLTSKPASNVDISLSGIVSTEGSVTPQVYTFTPSNWDAEQLVTVNGADDLVDDDDVTYTINLSAASADANYNGISISSVSVTNTDNDNAGISVSKTAITTSEAGSGVSFTVVLDTKPTINVPVTVASGNTGEGTVSAGTLTFTPTNWNSPQTVTVTPVNDNVDDGDITYQVNLSVASGDAKYIGKAAQVSVTNTDDDTAGIVLSKTTATTTEDGGTDVVQVKLSSRPTAEVRISVVSSNTNEGTVSLSLLVFNSTTWNTNQPITITGVNDSSIDGDTPYTITFAVTAGDAAYLAVPSRQVNATNTDNDIAALVITKTNLTTSEDGTADSFGVSLSSQPKNTVTVSITGFNALEGSLDKTSLEFTTANWSAAQVVTVTGKDDVVADGNKTYTLTATASSADTDYHGVTGSPISVTNIDNDTPGITVSTATLQTTEGASNTFSISLSSQPVKDVTINVSSSDLTEGTLSVSNVTFTPTDWAAKTVTVNGVVDDVDDGDQTYNVVLANSISDDPNYTNLDVADVSVTNIDINTAGITVSAISGNTGENLTAATFTVKLKSKPVANVVITSTSKDATEGSVTSNATITIAPADWNTPVTVTVTGENDFVADGDVDYAIGVTVSSTDDKYNGFVITDVAVTNTDNDAVGVTIDVNDGLETSEDETSDTFTVKLTSEPTAEVSIAITSGNALEGVLDKSVLKFNSSNWDAAQTVTLTGLNDDVADGSQTFSISFATTSADPLYNAISIANISATNTDNDAVGVTVSAISGNTTEAGGTATFTVKLNSEPVNAVTITSVSDNSAEGTVSLGASLIFDNTNWNVAQTVTVKGANDFVDDGDVSYTISLSVSSSDIGYHGLALPKVSVTNTDDDNAGVILSTLSLSTAEPNVNASFTVRLSSKPLGDVTVSFTSSDITEGTVPALPITFTPATWDTEQTVTITAADDNLFDGDIAYQIAVSVASVADALYDALADKSIAVVNADNDVVGVEVIPTAGLYTTEAGESVTFNVSLKSEPLNPVTISLSSSNISEGLVTSVTRGSVNTATNEATVTFEPSEWNSPVTVTVTGVDDDVDDGDIAYSIITGKAQSSDGDYNNLDVVDVSLTNKNNDSFGSTVSPVSITLDESGAGKPFTVRLNSRPTTDVTFNLSSSKENRATVTPTSVTFTPDADSWKTPVEFTVSPVANSIDDGDGEVTIVISTAVSTDGKYKTHNPVDVAVTVVDDDAKGIAVSPISGNTSEEGATATFTVVLNSEPTGDVVIGISSSNELEGTVSPVSIEFTPLNWSTPQTVTVTGVDDMVADGSSTYYIDFAETVSTDENYNGITLTSVEVVNTDDDSPGVNRFPIANLSTTEAGGTCQVSVRLSSMPTADVTINVSSSNTAEGVVGASQLLFTPANWSTEQPVTVTGVDDNLPDGDVAFNLQFSITSDDAGYAALVLSDVPVTNRDDVAPRATDDAAATDEDTPVAIDVLANDLGLDYGSLAVTIATASVQGSVVVNADNTITYTPNKEFNGTESFEYSVCEANGACDVATVSVETTFVNDTPIANADSRGATKNTLAVVDVLFNDQNLWDGGLVVTISEQSANGFAEANADNTVNFSPAPDFVGVTTFKYRVCDAQSDCSEAMVTMTVRESNLVPVANADAETVLKNTPKNIMVLANDVLGDGANILEVNANPLHGTALVNASGYIVYTPAADYVGPDAFTYLLKDVDGDQSLATVSITVTERPNALPVANAVSTATEMNIPVDIDVLFYCSGLEDGVKAITFSTEPANGVATVTLDPVTNQPLVRYTPKADWIGTEVFGYQVTDNNDDNSNVATITVVVKPTGTDHQPVAGDISVSTRINTPKEIAVLDYVTGLEDGFKRIWIKTSPSLGAALVTASNTVIYTPSNGIKGNDTFIYVVEDADGQFDTGTVSVSIVEFLDVTPVAVNDNATVVFETPTDINVLYNDTGLDNTPITVSISTMPDVAGCTATVNADNTIRFTPATAFSGAVNFGYTLVDAAGKSASASVAVTVLASGETVVYPVAADFTVTTRVNIPVVIPALEHVTSLTQFGGLFIHTQPALGTAVVNADNTITYTPSNFYKGSQTFEYRVLDAHYNVWDAGVITVNIVENLDITPVAIDDVTSVLYETPTDIDVLFNDSNLSNTPVVVTIASAPSVAGCTATVNANNSIHFIPATGFSGAVTLGYTVTDAAGKSASATVSITVLEEGETIVYPVASDFEVNTYVGVPVDIKALEHVTSLTQFGGLYVHTAPVVGTAAVTAQNTILYTPSPLYKGTLTFQYRVLDAKYSVWDAATITVNVIDRPNSVPVAVNDSRATEYQTPIVIDVLQNDTGIDDVPLVVSVSATPTSGTAAVNADNSITYTPASGYVGMVTFQYTVTDKNGDFGTATVSVEVLPEGVVNHIPVAADDNAQTSVNTAKDINVLANDTGLEDGFGSITVLASPRYGTATVNANRTVRYVPSPWFKGTDTFTYLLADAQGDNDVATVTVSVVDRPNALPDANDFSVATSKNIPVTIDVMANVTGADDTPITLTVKQNPAAEQGAVVVNANNTITFTPVAEFVGLSGFQYQVTDADGDSDFATVTVRVKDGVNAVPVANDDEYSTQVNTPAVLDVLSNDTNLDDGFGAIAIVEPPLFGEATVNADNTITFTPSNFYVGTMTFVYKLSDVDGDFDLATVSVIVSDGGNSLPIAIDDFAGTEFETPVTVDVLENDANLNDVPISVFISENASSTVGNAIVVAGNLVRFTPAQGYSGIATFKYRIRGFNGDVSEATVTITVLAEGEVNHLPVANADSRGTEYQTAVTVDVLANDTGLEDAPVVVTISTNPTSGTAAINADNTVTFTPAAGFSGVATFGYTVTDAQGDHATATVTITVLAEGEVNHLPVANADSRGTEYQTPVTVDVLANDTGLEDAPVAVTISTTSANGIAVVNADNTVTFTPAAGFTGVVTFGYTVTDAQGDYATATVTITVLAEGEVNHLPVANADSRGTEYQTAVTVDVLANDTGLEDAPVVVTISTNPISGTAAVNADNTVTFTPAAGFSGVATFGYTVTDAQGDYATATVTITVLAEGEVNHLPVANADSRGTEYQTAVTVDVLANDTGLEDAPVVVTISTNATSGTAAVNADNTVAFTPAAGFSGIANFGYTVTDAQGDYAIATVTITVLAEGEENHIPVANDDRRGTSKSAAVTIAVLENDYGLEDQPVLVSISQAPHVAQGTVSVNEDNTIVFTPSGDYVGAATFNYIVTDTNGDSDEATVVVNVKKDVNYLPDANDDEVETFVDTPINIVALTNDTGLNDAPVFLTEETAPSNTEGTIVVNDDNTILFTPASGYMGSVVFFYRITDFDGDYSIARVTVNVVENLPTIVAVDDAVNMMMNTTVDVNVLKNDTGIEKSSCTINIHNDVKNGYATMSSDGVLTYTPYIDFVGSDSLTYSICMGESNCSQAVVRITVEEPVPDALFIPEGFSPDGDGINDYFEIKGLKFFGRASVKIYNRWGNIVYSSDDYNNDWDGKSNVALSVGKTLPTGTYYYIIEVKGEKSKSYTGNVFLKR